MKKRLLIENDVNEMTDFQKILLLNKRKLSPDDVEFISSEYEIDLNKVQVKPDGLLFDFDDLEQFLKFFHYPAFEEGSDGEWDAINYDRMYYGQYDFYSNCQDRAYDDWQEGYTLGYLCGEANNRLRELLKIIAPNLVKYISEDGKKIDGEGEISAVLDKYFRGFGDEVDEIICSAKSNATFQLISQGKTWNLASPQVLGIVNCTPDSFFAGNRFEATDQATAEGIDHCLPSLTHPRQGNACCQSSV